LADDATAVINFDDPAASRWRGMAGGARVLGFGLHSDAFSSVVGAVTPTDVGSRFTLRLDDTEQLIELPLPGHHNVMNALAAAAATWAVGTSIADIAAGLRACQGVGGRLQSVAGRHGARLIDDSYNANPNSVRAAVDILARMPGTRWLVLGDMAELGADGAQLHASIGRYAAEQGVDGLLTVGELAACAADAFGASAISVASVAAAAVALEAQLAPDVTLLIKGSRSMGLERLVAALAREEALC
jgi:UDP-N-acetylmuramoyl-tripeptide--D-alanyl-D-alanine ligase